MAMDFRAIITGEADLTKAKQSFADFKKQVETPIKLTFDTSGFSINLNNVQKQLQQQGAQAGTQYTKALQNNIKNLKIPNGVFNRFFAGVFPFENGLANIDNGSLMTYLGADLDLAKQLNAEFKKINAEGGALQKIKFSPSGNSFEAQIKNANTLINVVGRLRDITDDATGQVIGKEWGITQQSAVTDYTNVLKQAQSEAQKLAEDVAKIGKASDNGDFSANVKTMTKELSSISDTVSTNLVQKAKDAADEYKKITDDITASVNNTAKNPLEGQDLVDAYKKSEDALKKYRNAMKEVRADTTKMFAEGANIRAANDVEGWAKKNSRALKQYGSQLEQLAQQMRNAKSAGELSKLQNDFKNLKSEINAAGLGGLTFGDQLKKAFVHIGEFTGIYAITSQLRQLPGEMAREVIKIDTAMTELKKVSTASASEISDYFDKATDSASKFGQTIDEVVNSTASWTRLGYDLDDASILTDVTAELAQVGSGLNVDTATEGLQATIRGFAMTAEQAKSAADAINMVADHAPIDALGIINGLERSSAVMRETNNSLEETIGLITATTSVTQDATSAGTAWRTKFKKRNCANVQKCA